MSAAALTPRVRIMVICDGVIPSEIEDKVFTLEGVRQQRQAESLPYLCELSVFLVLSSPHQGDFRGLLLLRNQRGEIIRSQRFSVRFEQTNDLLPVIVDAGQCEFPVSGSYVFEVWFLDADLHYVQKAEQNFFLLPHEE